MPDEHTRKTKPARLNLSKADEDVAAEGAHLLNSPRLLRSGRRIEAPAGPAASAEGARAPTRPGSPGPIEVESSSDSPREAAAASSPRGQDGDQPAPKAASPVEASSSRRRQRPDTSVSVSRPPRQKMRTQEPSARGPSSSRASPEAEGASQTLHDEDSGLSDAGVRGESIAPSDTTMRDGSIAPSGASKRDASIASERRDEDQPLWNSSSSVFAPSDDQPAGPGELPRDEALPEKDGRTGPGGLRGNQPQTANYRRQQGLEVFVRDPDTRNEKGNFKEEPALVIGRLAMRGKMAVELPSKNPAFPDCPRRFSITCRDYNISWRALRALQKRDLDRLKEIADKEREQEEPGWRPEVVGIVSTPQYGDEVQANPVHVLKLRLSGGDEWHSKSDAFAAFGELNLEMQEYWSRSGQDMPRKPRPAQHRAHLQHIGVEHGGESSLPEVDAECVTNREQLLRLTKELQARARQAKHDTADESAGEDETSDLSEKRGRARTRRS